MVMVRAVKSSEVYVGMRICRRVKVESKLECGAVIKICEVDKNIIRGMLRIDGSMKDEVFTVNDNILGGRYCVERPYEF